GVTRAGHLRPALVVVLVASVAWLAMQRGAPWDDELSSLNPAPQADLALDAEIRRDLGAPDIGPMVVVRANTAQQALETSERIGAMLEDLRHGGGLDHFDS